MQDNYPDTINELFALQKFSIKMGLENIKAICKQLNDPHTRYPMIHVAGTNGKGSTSLMIHSILSAHELKVGLYTSPHLMDFRERIRINDQLIDKKFIVFFWQRVKELVHDLKATFFDTTTAMAFSYFGESAVDLAVIETGLGGRLDSTNIIRPEAVVITPIAIDHTKQLGRNLKSIAGEKASIIKAGATVFSARQKKSVREVLENKKRRATRSHRLLDKLIIYSIKTSKDGSFFSLRDKQRQIELTNIKFNLLGKFQIDNAGLAYLVSRWYLDKLKIKFSEKTFRDVMKNLQWAGRMQRINQSPDVYLDVGHNYSGFRESMEFIKTVAEKQSCHLLLGLLDDKEYKRIIRLLQKYFRYIYITEPNHERALSAKILKQEFQRYNRNVKIVTQINAAYQFALKNLKNSDTLFVMGSHFLISEILIRRAKST